MERGEAGDGFVKGGFYGLRHLGEESQESIAMRVIHVIGEGAHAFIGARKHLFIKEIFTRHVGKSRHPLGDVAGVRAMVGKEFRIKKVPDAPDEDVVGEGIGLPRWSDSANNASVLAIAGHAHECFDEASAPVGECACPAIDGDEERHQPWVVDGVELIGVDFGLVPFVVPSVVAVLHDVGALVEGLDDVLGAGTHPWADRKRIGGDIAQSVGTEIGYDGIGAAGGRPLVA